MTLSKFCDLLQTYCNSGYACDEVEIFDEDEGIFLKLDKVKIERNHDKEIIALEFEHSH